MARVRPEAPAGNGGVVAEPPYCDWAGLVADNRAARADWTFSVGGLPVAEFVALARAQAAEQAVRFSRRLGVAVQTGLDPDGPLIMTGHQPELYHPGVWAKDFFLQRLADDLGALAIDAVVDSDTFDALAIEAPCMRPEVARCREVLALGGPDVTYAGVAPLTVEEVDRFASLTLEMLRTLPAPSVARHFERFAGSLASAASDAHSVAELVTIARRRYETEASTTYLEWPVSSFVGSTAFCSFVAGIAADASRFAGVLNGCLARSRERSGLRGAGQPFPDLDVVDESVELPFWVLIDGRRHRLWAVETPEGTSLRTFRGADSELVTLPRDTAEAGEALAASGLLVVPRAVTLTLYIRMFVADLFIHGTGGAKYDQVTDDLVRAWYGVEPPHFAVASLTLYLPLGIHIVGDEEIDEVRGTLQRLIHNPDQLLGGLHFEDPAERLQMEDLAASKGALVASIAAPGADKKLLGRRIREVNEQLAAHLEPLRAELTERLDTLTSEQAAVDVLMDRTYPFCYWSPLEVAGTVG